MGKGLAISGFICSIVGLVLGFLGGVFSIVSLPVSVVGLVLAVIGGKKLAAANQPKGLATAGLVLGIIAVCISTVLFFTCGICVLVAASSLGVI